MEKTKRALKKIILNIVVIGLLIPALPALGADLPEAFVLSDHPYCQKPSVATTSDGSTVLAVWVEGTAVSGGIAGYKAIWYRVCQDGQWNTAQKFTGPVNPEHPALVVDSNGDFHMIWMEGYGGGRDIAYATFSNGQWSSWTGATSNFVQVTVNQRDVWPRLAIDPADDSLHAIWSRHKTTAVSGDAEIFYARKAPGGSWQVRQVSNNGYRHLYYHSDITARNGRIWAVWEDNTTYVSYASKRNSDGSWTTPVSIHPEFAGATKWPCVTNDSNGNVHALYSTAWGPYRYNYRPVDAGWLYMGLMNTNDRYKIHGDIRVDGADNVYAVFQQRGDESFLVDSTLGNMYNTSLLMSMGDSAGNMGDPVLMWRRANAYVHTPVVAPDDNGGVHIVFYDAGVGFPENKWLDWGPIYYIKAQGAAAYRVHVTSPNGGEVWRIGEEQTLVWEATAPEGEPEIETVAIEYSLDGGSTWNMLYDAVPNVGTVTEAIPRDQVQPSTRCRFRITDPVSGVSDISDGDFTLLPPYAESGASFDKAGVWQTAVNGLDGWYIGDYTGDGLVDIMNVTNLHQKVFQSDGTQFIKLGSWIKALTGSYGWFPGDFNGDDKTDLLRYRDGNRSQVFLSTGTAFVKDFIWAYADPGPEGYTVGDFNGDGRDDMLIFNANTNDSMVYLSTGETFLDPVSWFNGHTGTDGWYPGDFNGDGMTDLARVTAGVGTQVMLSTGSAFSKDAVWTEAMPESDGWHVGDFNGDGYADLMRYLPNLSGADVFLSNGESFAWDGSWTDAEPMGADWDVGDFTGDGRDDLLRYITADRRTQVFVSTGGSAPAGTSSLYRPGIASTGDLNTGVDTSRSSLSPEAEAELMRPWLERIHNGDNGNFFFSIKKEYEKRLGRKVRDVVIYRMLYRLQVPAPRD